MNRLISITEKVLKKFLPKSEFAKNVLVLMTGTTMAQAIPVAISPILTRLYTPEDFGLLSIFVSIAAIFGSIANGRYELAVMLPEDDEDAVAIVWLGLLISFVIAALLAAIFYIWGNSFSLWLGNEAIASWLYFIPICVFLISGFNLLRYFNIRLKSYKDIAGAQVNKSLASSITQLSLGKVILGAAGLIIGQIASYFFANLRLWRNFNKSRVTVSKSAILSVAKRYKRFPIFSTWSILANSLATNLLNILISSFFGMAILGFYSFVQRIMSAPMVLIGNSIGQVFFQQAVLEKNKTGVARKSFDTVSKRLISISLPFFFLIYFYIVDIFEFVFGHDWKIAGQYAKILLPLFAIRFVVSALSNINNIFEKQQIAMLWQFGLLVISLIIFYVAIQFDFSFEKFLYVYTSILCLYYVFLYWILFKVSRGQL